MRKYFVNRFFNTLTTQTAGISQMLLVAASLFACLQLSAQKLRIDTIKEHIETDTSSWIYKMGQSDDKWGRTAAKKDFQLFLRDNYDRSTKKDLYTANVSYYGNATLFWLNDIREVEVAAAGVTAENAKDFIYHVTLNDSIEIVPWTKPLAFHTNKHITYAYLGKFDTHNKLVKLEFYNIKNYRDRSTWIFNGLYMPAASVHLVVLNFNNRYLSRPFMQVHIPDNKVHYYSLGEKNSVPISFNWSDSINSIKVIMKNTVLNEMYNVYLQKVIGHKTDTVHISNVWGISVHSPDPEMSINSSNFNKPGEYKIIIVPEAPDEFKVNSMNKAVTIPFTVLPAKAASFSGMELLKIVGIIVLFGLILFLVYYFINKRRIDQAAQQKEKVTLELQSVRSQLNPHFMFNALAGIQNLMNKGDINATNNYLSKFSRITRNVLDDRNKEVISINEEVSLLEDYLQMEQMRFGFNYNIHIDEKIDRANTEIPSMLLQPYIENAVKHGVSSLKNAGVIAIAILLKSGSLVMEVKDNGQGYNSKTNVAGNGTLLSEKRVDLINQLNNKNTIKVFKQSGESGTTISIELNDWV